jgi:hypothetical protein
LIKIVAWRFKEILTQWSYLTSRACMKMLRIQLESTTRLLHSCVHSRSVHIILTAVPMAKRVKLAGDSNVLGMNKVAED